MRERVVFVLIVLGVLGAVVGVSRALAGGEVPNLQRQPDEPRTVPRLDAERIVGRQDGQTYPFIHCPVSQVALEETQLKAVKGTLSYAFVGTPKRKQLAQHLTWVVVHKQPLVEWKVGRHHEAPRGQFVGAWNQKLVPTARASTISVRGGLWWPWTLEEGTYVTLCWAMTSTHHSRSNLESQLYLVTDKNMRTVRHLEVCEC